MKKQTENSQKQETMTPKECMELAKDILKKPLGTAKYSLNRIASSDLSSSEKAMVQIGVCYETIEEQKKHSGSDLEELCMIYQVLKKEESVNPFEKKEKYLREVTRSMINAGVWQYESREQIKKEFEKTNDKSGFEDLVGVLAGTIHWNRSSTPALSYLIEGYEISKKIDNYKSGEIEYGIFRELDSCCPSHGVVHNLIDTLAKHSDIKLLKKVAEKSEKINLFCAYSAYKHLGDNESCERIAATAKRVMPKEDYKRFIERYQLANKLLSPKERLLMNF